MGNIIIFTAVLGLLSQVECKDCPFSYTNETLADCQLSRWLSWNCTCCGIDVVTYPLANRQRGICCGPGEAVKPCLVRCGYAETDDTEYGVCEDKCPGKTTPTNCAYVKTIVEPPSSTRATTISTAALASTSGTIFAQTSHVGGTNNIMTSNVKATPGQPSASSTMPADHNSPTIRNTENRTYLTVGIVGGVLGALSVISCCLFIVIRKKKRKNKVITDRDLPASEHGRSP